MEKAKDQGYSVETLIKLACFVLNEDEAMKFLSENAPILRSLISWDKRQPSEKSSINSASASECLNESRLTMENAKQVFTEARKVSSEINTQLEEVALLLEDAKRINQEWRDFYKDSSWESGKGTEVYLQVGSNSHRLSMPVKMLEMRTDYFQLVSTYFQDTKRLSEILDPWTSNLQHRESSLSISPNGLGTSESPAIVALWTYRNYRSDKMLQHGPGIKQHTFRKVSEFTHSLLNASLEISNSPRPRTDDTPNLSEAKSTISGAFEPGSQSTGVKIHPIWLVLCVFVAAAMCSKDSDTKVSGSFETRALLVSDDNFSAFASSYPTFNPPFLYDNVIWKPKGMNVAKGIICLESPQHETLILHKEVAKKYLDYDVTISVQDIISCFQ
jgi:hypothetical protein